MKIEIKRYIDEGEVHEERLGYEVDLEGATLLEMLTEIKTKQDATLSFASGCRSSVCGSCAMRVNGKEVLACAYKPQEGDVVEPLKNMPVIRDLVVDMQKALDFTKVAKAWAGESDAAVALSEEDAAVNELQSDCILCGSCYSACPVYEVNGEFIGPFALTRSWRYVSDKRESDVAGKIEAVQTNGIWDCTLCGECVPVCPQGIAPKSDIDMLRNKSGILGYMDPKFVGGFGGGLDFGAPSF
ncbi:2Fe-2S iron-sulfur cluster-binding protein [Sulfurimonas sp. HSL3-7]|uniref:succinate dehydrogenase/fumarate reductase iron-sulfur subunit n=1 Tax=Sulfonitrofixus jiaomeiensis TaxID=3131938 RepID=UPI0031F7229A